MPLDFKSKPKHKPERSPLQLSKLDQLEALKHDLNLTSLGLALAGEKSAQIISRVRSANVRRTIEGASTLTVVVNDYDRTLLRSGRLTSKTDTEIDGLWFRLVHVAKQGDDLTLTFEDREVAVLRTYNKPLYNRWGQVDRCTFAGRLLKEVEEFAIPLKCSRKKKPKEDEDEATTVPDEEEKKTDRDYGISVVQKITVKGRDASAEQRKNIETILDVGANLGARRKVLVCAIMTATQESECINLEGGDGTSVGIFQITNDEEIDYARRRDVAESAYIFYKGTPSIAYRGGAIDIDKKNPNLPYWQLCADRQLPFEAYRTAYEKWRIEAERTVTAYGVAGGDVSSESAAASANNQQGWQPQISGDDFQFTRGTPIQDRLGRRRWKRENSWDCLGRLASEVNWRRFMVSGTCYLMSEPDLFKSPPRMRFKEFDVGIDAIDADFDTGKRNSQLTVNCRIHRWQAPPGSTVEVYDLGPMDGKWLVQDVERSLFSTSGKIVLTKPRPALPEPSESSKMWGWTAPPVDPPVGDPDEEQSTSLKPVPGSFRARIVAKAEAWYADRLLYAYDQVRPFPLNRYPASSHNKYDCSSFIIVCYYEATFGKDGKQEYGGEVDPGGGGFNGQGWSVSMEEKGDWVNIPRPGDIAVFGPSRGASTHVALVDGKGGVYSFGGPWGLPGPDYRTPPNYRSDFLGYLDVLKD